MNPRISRRVALKGGLTAVGGLAAAIAVELLSSGDGDRRVFPLRAYGAVGDGNHDDSPAFQRALDAAPAGSTVVGEPSATYFLNAPTPVSFPRDRVTLDLRGAELRAGFEAGSNPARIGQDDLYASDQILRIEFRTGVRVTNGRITASRERAHRRFPSTPTLIIINRSSGCVVDQIEAECYGAQLVWVQQGVQHTIHGNHLRHGSVAAFSVRQLQVTGNVIEDSPADAIAVVGYPGGAITDLRCVGNVIRGHGRIGIEDYAAGDAYRSRRTIIAGNQIGPPAPGHPQAFGISATGLGASVIGNVVTDAATYGIEAYGGGTDVSNNRLVWTSPGDGNAAGAIGVIVNSSPAGQPLAGSVRDNVIIGPRIGIGVYGRPYVGAANVERNQILDPLAVGVEASLGDSGAGSLGATISFNRVDFTSRSASSAVRDGIGIAAGHGARVRDNTIVYPAALPAARASQLGIQLDSTSHGVGNSIKHAT